MEPSRKLDEAVSILCTLDDEVRRACYLAVRESIGPATRSAVAAATGASVRLVAFHLDKLVDVGLLEADYLRPPGRGRGGGRPAKRYRPSSLGVEVTVPPRRYDIVATVLAESAATGEDHCVVAARLGAKLVETSDQRGSWRRRVPAILTDLGFEPLADGSGTMSQRNCPFEAVQQVAPLVVCGLNRALVQGILGAIPESTAEAKLEPAEGRCCVIVSDERA